MTLEKTEFDIECCSIKTTYQINYLNLYSKATFFKKCCIDCSPNSSIYYDAKNKSNYLINSYESNFGINLTKRFTKKNISTLVLENDSIKHFIEYSLDSIDKSDKSTDNAQLNSSHLAKSKFLKSIRDKLTSICLSIDASSVTFSSLSETFSNKYAFTAFKWICECLFSKILCSQSHLSALTTASKKHLPIIYVTKSDSSLLDKLIIQLALALEKFQLPHIFTNNLQASNFLNLKYIDDSKLKAFYTSNNINESSLFNKLNGTYSNDEPIFYKQILTTYLTEFFKIENDLIVNADNILIDCLIEMIEKEILHDLIIVPVGVNYELPIDMKSKWNLVKTFFYNLLFALSNGLVRVNFNQPFSIKEYLETMRFKLKQIDLFQNSSSLKRHINYDIFQMNSIMCTNIVAFILMTQFTNGCDYAHMCKKFNEITKDLSLNYQISFRSESTKNIIDYSIDLLRNYLNISNNLIKPKKDYFYHLYKLSRVVTDCYFMSSILANAIKLSLNTDYYHMKMHMNKSTPTLNENDLVFNAFKLIRIFQYEFSTFKKPCETVFSKVFQTINLFINSNLIYDQAHLDGSKTFKRNFSFEEDDDEDIQANLNNGTIKNENNSNLRITSFFSSSYMNQNYENDPDTNEIDKWLPDQCHKKLYKLKTDPENIALLREYSDILEIFVDIYINFLSFLNSLNVDLIYTAKEFYQLLEESKQRAIETKQIELNKNVIDELTKNALDWSIKMMFVKCVNAESYCVNKLKKNELKSTCIILKKL